MTSTRRRRSYVPISSENSDTEYDDDNFRKPSRGTSHVYEGRREDKMLSKKRSTKGKVVREHSSTDTDDDRPKRTSSRCRVNRRGSIPKASRNRKEIKPARYDGRGCVETYLAQFDICAAHIGWDEEERLAHLKCSLSDHAAQLIWDSGNPVDLTYDGLIEKLRRRYGSLDQQEKFQAELRSRRRHNGVFGRIMPGHSQNDDSGIPR